MPSPAALLATLRAGWHRLTRDSLAVFYAAYDPRTPRPARILALLTAVYAISPIDFIPDVMPPVGDLIDVLLMPLGILGVIRLLPPEVRDDARAQAEALLARRRGPAARLLVEILIGLAAAALAAWLVWR